MPEHCVGNTCGVRNGRKNVATTHSKNSPGLIFSNFFHSRLFFCCLCYLEKWELAKTKCLSPKLENTFKHRSNQTSNVGKGRLRTNLHGKALLTETRAVTTIHFSSKDIGTTKTTQKSSKISLVFTDSEKVPMQCNIESHSKPNKN